MRRSYLSAYQNTDIDSLLDLLSKEGDDFSVIDDNGKVHGAFIPWTGITQTEGNGRFEIFAGDQLIFAVDSVEEVKAFLLASFWIITETNHRGNS